MGYPVYEMPSVADAPAQYRANIRELIERLRRTDPSLNSGFLPFFEALGNCWFKKRYDKYRLIAKLEQVELDTGRKPCVVLVAFVRQDSQQYGSSSHLEQVFQPLIEAHHQRIRQEVEKHFATRPAPVRPPDPPSELLWLLEPLAPRERADTFFISNWFYRSYEKLSRDTERADVYRILQAVYNETETQTREQVGELLTRVGETCKLYYVQLREPGHGFRHVFLLGIVPNSWSADERRNSHSKIDELWNKLRQQVLEREFNDPACFMDALSQLAERAFPGYLLADDSLWQEIWKEREVFLPLSAEEIGNLNKILAAKKLPCVIEGRAGSGKSTLLIYYTAERLARHSDSAKRSPPFKLLYVTQSESLRKNAEAVVSLIRNRLASEFGESECQAVGSFLTYYDFCKEQLSEGRREQFPLGLARRYPRRRLDFLRFVDLLRGRSTDGLRDSFGRSKECTPEAVWFVLRSYIKGFKIHETGEERWMSAEEYQESDIIAQKDRQVSAELYEEVWKRVWPWYKRLTVPCSENDNNPPYWDDLDLAWEVLQHRRPDAPRYDILVCDEAQDFSRVEIASLLGALSWTQYNLASLPQLLGIGGQVVPLPVVFAGDAHQTINPSCFRWERVSADIAQSLTQHLADFPPLQVPTLKLEYNYRNAPSIAQLCNAIQHLRQIALGQKASLQRIWHPSEQQPNLRVRTLLLDDGSESAKDTLEKILTEGVLVIGPVPDDPDLDEARRFWQRLGYESPPADRKNLVITAEIKGLEHDVVGVMGFGIMAQLLQLDEVWHWKNAVDDPSVNEARRFQVEYFLNNLYVALSRAREQLWIIETREGWRAFWEPLKDWLQQPSATLPPDQQDVQFDFTCSPGDLSELVNVSRQNWPSLAQEYERLAHDQRSPEHAERAAYYYDRLGQPIDRDRMLAWAAYYRGEILEAAERMWRIEKARACDWFWEAAAEEPQAWQALTREGIEPEWRRKLATLYLQLNSEGQAVADLITWLRRLNDEKSIPKDFGSPAWPTWENIALETLAQVHRRHDLSDTIKQEAYRLASSLAPRDPYFRSYKRWQALCAELAYGLKDYTSAAEHWEKAEDIQHKRYFTAKGITSPYPECLRWWESAGEIDQLLLQFDQHIQEPLLDPGDRLRVARAAESRQRFKTAFQLYAGLDQAKAFEFWKRWLESLGEVSDLTPAVVEALDSMNKICFADMEINPHSLSGWTNLIFDLIIDSNQARVSEREGWNEELVKGLVWGFGLGHDIDSLRSRFRGSWNTRNYPDSNWPRFRDYLCAIVRHALHWNQGYFQRWKNADLEHAARLALLSMGLICRLERRKQEQIQKQNLPRYRPVLCEYMQVESSELGTNWLSSCNPELMEVIKASLRVVADGPEDWIREPKEKTKSKPWMDLTDFVDALAYDLYESVSSLARGFHSGVIFPLDWWLLCGRFVEQAPYRFQAIRFYRELLRLGGSLQWSDPELGLIGKRLEAYEERFYRWREQRDRETRAPGEAVYIRPGTERRTDLVRIVNSADQPQVVLTFSPENYEFHFWLEDSSDQPNIRASEQLDFSGPRTTGPELIWTIVHQDRHTHIRWHREKHTLTIEIEDDPLTYVINLAIKGPLAGEMFYINPGEERRTDLVRIKSLAHRPEAILSFQPEEYIVRFIPPHAGEQPYVKIDTELRHWGPEVIEDKLVYTLQHRNRRVNIIWHKQNRVLYIEIEADRRTYVVTFPILRED